LIKKNKIISQTNRPFVAQTTVLKHHMPRLRPVAAIGPSAHKLI